MPSGTNCQNSSSGATRTSRKRTWSASTGGAWRTTSRRSAPSWSASRSRAGWSSQLSSTALGAIAREYGRDEAELTTRQGIQLHWVRMAMLPEVLAAIEAAGLTTCGAEGDTVRNITGCPVVGLSAASRST